jgi:hypothetical protein
MLKNTHFNKYTTAKKSKIQPNFASKFVEKKSFIYVQILLKNSSTTLGLLLYVVNFSEFCKS